MALREDLAALRYAIDALLPVLQSLQPIPPAQAWPVGSLFISTLAGSPAEVLGYGVWESYGAGRVIVGVDPEQPEFAAPGSTGGAKTHTLTVDELAAHAHPLESRTLGTGVDPTYELGAIDITSTDAPEGLTTAPAGGGQPHNNLQPYIVAHIWRRTS